MVFNVAHQGVEEGTHTQLQVLPDHNKQTSDKMKETTTVLGEFISECGIRKQLMLMKQGTILSLFYYPALYTGPSVFTSHYPLTPDLLLGS